MHGRPPRQHCGPVLGNLRVLRDALRRQRRGQSFRAAGSRPRLCVVSLGDGPSSGVGLAAPISKPATPRCRPRRAPGWKRMRNVEVHDGSGGEACGGQGGTGKIQEHAVSRSMAEVWTLRVSRQRSVRHRFGRSNRQTTSVSPAGLQDVIPRRDGHPGSGFNNPRLGDRPAW